MGDPLLIRVSFYSYCRDLAGVDETRVAVPEGKTLAGLMTQLYSTHPRLRALDKSLLLAVGVEYQTREYVLRPGDEVALFPPVQGG